MGHVGWDGWTRTSGMRVPKTRALPTWRRPKITILARLRGFEPLAHGLEGRCSIQLSYRRIGAGEENRTLATSLEGWGSTTELHPQIKIKF